MKKILLLIATIILTINGYTQTNLSAGDIAFLGSNTDGATNLDDSFAFVLLKDIDAATTIIFTDRGWNDSTNSFFSYPGDGEMTWTSGIARSKGDIITLDLSGLNPVSTAYSYIGDQLFAIQGSISTPIFIAGLQFNNVASGGDDANWDGAAIDNATSALPDDLITGNTAVRLINISNLEQDNWQFSCNLAGANPIEGTPEQIRAILHNRNNWVSNDTNVYNPAVESGCAISIVDNCQTSDASTAFNDEATDGFGSWTFVDTSNSGHFTASSTDNGDGDNNNDDDINSTGGAWGLFANSGQIAEMIRPFDSPLSTGDTFSIQMDNGWIESGGVVGFSLRNNSGENLLEFYYSNGQPSYTIDNLNGAEGTGIGFTDEGLQFDLTMTSNNTVDITITELFNGATHNFSKSLKNPSGGQVISILRMFNFNAGFNSERNAYFNNLEVCTSPGTDNDGDGFNDDIDCDDNDAAVNPDADEINFNGIDDDCNPDSLDENSGIFESYVIVNSAYYDLMANTANTDFDANNLGNLTCTDVLVLNGAQNKTFKCDTGDITNSKLFYRVYESSSSPSAFIELNLGFLSNDGGAPAGCQNQTWQTATHNVDILNSLAPGNYTLEVYTTADYTHDTGSGTHQADNGGSNYVATFSVFDDAPTAVCNNITVQLDASGNYTLTQADIEAIGNGTTDACGDVTFSVDNTTFDCSDLSGGPSILDDLFISEYIEGSSNNKCIEIYNGTGVAIDLSASAYTLERYSNGGTTPTAIALNGTVANGDVYVICNPSSTAAFLNEADETNSNINFNGDDAVVLLKNGTPIDVFGKVGQDPGSEWNQGGNTTANNTLVRNSGVTQGNTDDATDFPSLATEWTEFTQDYSDNLGTHTVSGGGASPTVILTVTDSNGNTATCTTTITVEDNTAPNAICQAFTLQLDGNGVGVLTAEDIDGGSNDACGIASLSASQTDFDCSHLGTNTVTLTVTDNNGNTATCDATVTVEDKVAPTVVCNDITVELDASGNYTLTQEDINAIGLGSEDACGDVTFSVDNDTFDCSDVSTTGVVIPSVWINEIHYDNDGGDVGEFIEIAGTAGIDLSAYDLLAYDSDNALDSTVQLSGIIPDEGSGFGAIAFYLSDLNSQFFENGPSEGRALVTSGNVVDFISYEGIVIASDGAASGATSTNIGEEPGDTPIGQSLQQTGDGTAPWVGPTTASPGTLNTGQSLSSGGGSQITFTVTDENGNSATCTVTITVEDNIAPNTVCQVFTVQLDSNGVGVLTAEDIDGGSNDACGIASLSASQTDFDCSHIGTNTVTLTVTDNNGNTATCDATVTVEDNVPPTAVCATDIVVQLDASGNGTLTVADVDGGSTDNCGVANVTIDNSSFTCNDIGGGSSNPPVTESFEDWSDGSYGGTATATLASGMWESNNALTGDHAYSGSRGVRFNDDSGENEYLLYKGFDGNGKDGGLGTISFWYRHWDGDGSNVEFQVQYNQSGAGWINVGPVVNAPSTTWMQFSESPNITGDDILVRIISIDDAERISFDDFSMSDASAGPTVTLTVTDVNGNVSTCTAPVTVEDNIAPNVVCNPFEVELDASGNYTLTQADLEEIADGSSDACGIADISVSPNSFSCADAGEVIDVTLSVTDNNGNTNSCMTVILVEDITAPTVVCNDITVELDATGNYTLTPEDINAIGFGSDDACGDVTFSVDNANFDCSDVVISEPIVAADLFFSEYVEGSSFNKYIEIFNGTGSNVDLSDYELRLYSNGASGPSTSNDLSGILNDGNVIVYQNSSASVYGGTAMNATAVNWNGDDTVVLWKKSTNTAVDIFGKIGEDPGSQWSVAGNTTQNQTLRRNSSVTQGNIDDVSGFPSLGTEWTGLAQDDVTGLGTHSMSSGNLNSPTVTLTVTDVNGNSDTCVATVTVLDNILPTVVCNSITVELDDSGNYTLSSVDIDAIANGSEDNCGIASLSVSPESFTCAEIGQNTITLTVTDINGNVDSCTTTVNVIDTTAPVVVCQDMTVQLGANGSASIVAGDIDGGSYDVCSNVTLAISQNSFDCDDVNAIVPINDLFISEYIEGSGNNKCIEIFNGTGSSVNLTNYTLVRYSNGTTSGSNISLSGTIADGDVHVICNSSADGAFLAEADQTSGSLSHNGDDAYELVNSGNVIDIFGSVGEDPGAEWNVAGNETQDRTLRRNINITKGNINNTAGFPSLGTEWTEFAQNNADDLGSHTVDARGVEVTLTVTDAYGNSDTCVAIVRVEDNIAPEITCVPNTTLDTDLGVCDYTVVGTELDATFTDNCSSGIITNDYNNSDSLVGAIFPQGTTVVTWTADDGNGQTVSCTTEVTVEDNEAPVVNCLSLQVQLDEFGNGSITEDDIDGDSYDNCEIASISLS
ncbi:lamin tail domain-containing protein, partial [Hanstruepera ponticola]|uniref:lamin tail domain-containing protein n=1 Tax=Hanstruepera ponticola TaxID=2042995 RepID=UPI00177B787B